MSTNMFYGITRISISVAIIFCFAYGEPKKAKRENCQLLHYCPILIALAKLFDSPIQKVHCPLFWFKCTQVHWPLFLIALPAFCKHDVSSSIIKGHVLRKVPPKKLGIRWSVSIDQRTFFLLIILHTVIVMIKICIPY